MADYRNMAFQQRMGKMGDEAEEVFERTYPHGWERLGLNRPRVNLKDVPPFVRHLPDYLTGKSLVEAQGMGRDGTLKMKLDKLAALVMWQGFFRVDLFVWDSHRKEYGWVRLPELQALVARHEIPVHQFHDGPLYHAIPKDMVPVVDGWVPFDLRAARLADEKAAA